MTNALKELEREVIERFEEDAKIPIRKLPGWMPILMVETGIEDYTLLP